MTLGEYITAFRKENGLSQREFAKNCGVSHSYIAFIEKNENPRTGKPIEVSVSMLKGISSGLGLTVDKLVRIVDDIDLNISDNQISFDNLHPVDRKKFRLLGEVACGSPIVANEEFELYVESGTDVKADYCLKARGDSMVNARINDGDIVFIKNQDVVRNGEIAAVVIADEITLKRVYYYPDKDMLILKAENPKYEDMIYTGVELEQIKILGKAVAFQSDCA